MLLPTTTPMQSRVDRWSALLFRQLAAMASDGTDSLFGVRLTPQLPRWFTESDASELALFTHL